MGSDRESLLKRIDEFYANKIKNAETRGEEKNLLYEVLRIVGLPRVQFELSQR